jgi:Tfp pilus assembly protein PilF
MAARNNKYNLIESMFLDSWRPYAWIVVAGFILYFKSLFFSFVYFDDNSLVIDNFFFLKDIANITKIFTQGVFHVLHTPETYYRPMLTLSFMLDAQMGGLNPFFYHLSNMILHLIASVLVFVLFIKLKYRKDLSFLFSIIFTVHPVLTQAVAWIPGRNDSLLAVFLLPSFIFFLNYLEKGKRIDLIWHLLFFALALFTKEAVLALVLICVFYLHAIAKDKLFSLNERKLAAGWLFVVVVWFLLRRIALTNPMDMTVFDMSKSLWLNLPALIQFTGKILLPVNLSVLPIIQDTSFVYGIVAIIVMLTALLLTQGRRYNYIVFGLLWFLLFLLPAFISPNPDVVADFIEHRSYVPMIGFMIILMETGAVKNADILKRSTMVITASIILIFAGMTFYHLDNFKDPFMFWGNAVITSPHHPMAHRNLGAMYYLSGNFDNAETEYKKALELSPNEPMVHNNLGLIYMNRERLNEAEFEFLKENAINPLWDNLHYNLGLLYAREGRLKEAEAQWKRTVDINPDHGDALYQLAIYYYGEKEYTLARYYAKEAGKRGVQIDPEFLKALNLRP